MSRKKRPPEHVSHERWLVSYADFITLLFAFFVVMFAVSQVDSNKVGRFTESFSQAVGIDPLMGPGGDISADLGQANGGGAGVLAGSPAKEIEEFQGVLEERA